MKRRQYLRTAGASISVPLIAGCSGDNETDSDSGDPDGNDGGGGGSDGDDNEEPDLEILNHEFYEEAYSAGVKGTAQNNTDSELSYAEIEVVFLDSEGTQIEDGMDNVNELAAGRKWEFDCMFLGDDPSRVDSYEIEASTGF